MSDDAEDIRENAWDEIKWYGMALANEIEADDSVASDPRLVSDYALIPWQSLGGRIKAMDGHVQSIHDYISSKNIDKLVACISSIEQAGYTEEDIYWYLQEVKSRFDSVCVHEAELIYRLPDTNIVVPEIIIPAQEKILSLAKQNPEILHSISPREFEELVAEVFDRQGFDVELTKATRDGGKDIIAIQSHMGIDLKYIIECKRYARDNKISLDIVQRLYGVKIAEKANKAILVTTSSFTRDANKFASQHCWDLSLKDRDDFISWLTEV